MRKPAFVLLSLFLAFASLSKANDSEIQTFLIEQAIEEKLHEHNTWRKLLHFRGNRGKSDVNSEEFFLSSNGSNDPKAELEATIAGYFQNDEDFSDSHPRCRFPARYYWLSQHLTIPGYSLKEPDCQNFEKWALLDKVKSASLYLVSGYFGNPASTFGHSLLKLNTHSQDDQTGLFDLTINYGALVPENELTAIYIVRGLTGGYQAGFSDQYFYSQDQVYSRTEFRDIWDFELNLSDTQRTLLVLHLWEIIAKKFDYYFLKENCAYRIAELIELATEETFLDQAKAWYVPVEMFHRLTEIDTAYRNQGKPGLIKNIEAIPSSRRKLYANLSQLPPDSLALVNALLKKGPETDFSGLDSLPSDTQLDILDALYEYYQYKQAGEEPNPSAELLQAKSQVLAQRLRRPARQSTPIDTPTPTLPTTTPQPLKTSVGIGVNDTDKLFTLLNWTAYTQESLAPNSLEGSELTALSATFGLNSGHLFIDTFDLIRIEKLNTSNVKLYGESRNSWRLRIGMDKVGSNNQTSDDWLAAFGLGRSWKFSDQTQLSTLAIASGHSTGESLRIRPEIGLNNSSGKIRSKLYLGIENAENNEFNEVWGGAIQYQLEKNKAIRLEFNNERFSRASLSALFYW